MIRQITAFDLDGDRPTPKPPELLILPEPLIHMICRNMRWFLGVECVTTDYRVTPDRTIDAICIDDQNLPVVVKFRRQPGENIVERAQDDLGWLLDHPDTVEWAIKQFTTIEPSTVRCDWMEVVICIAAGFSTEEILAAQESNMWGDPVHLIQVLRSDDGHVVFLPLDTSPQQSEDVGRNLEALENSEALAAATGVAENELRQWIKEEIQAAFRAELDDRLESLSLVDSGHSQAHEVEASSTPLFHVSSRAESALAVLQSLPSDTPRSTRFLYVLQASLSDDDRFAAEVPGKTTLRAAFDELGSGCELVFGVRRHDARVEWYIPRTYSNRDLIDAIDKYWDATVNQFGTYERTDDHHAVRIYRMSSIQFGWNDLEAVWPEVVDDLDDIMSIFQDSISEFYLRALGYDPLS